MKSETEKLQLYVERVILRAKRKAAFRVRDMVESERPWEERTVADVASLKLVELVEAEKRANKLAARGPAMLGVVVLPARAASIDEWETEAARLDAAGRPVIDAAAVLEPVLKTAKGE